MHNKHVNREPETEIEWLCSQKMLNQYMGKPASVWLTTNIQVKCQNICSLEIENGKLT